MKRRTLALIAIVAVIVLVPVMFFLGNPLSYLLIPMRGNAYLAENYPDLDVKIQDVGYDFKVGGWSAMAVSPTSRDTWFPVYIDGWGNVEGDGYSLVLSRSTTAERIAKDYKALAEPILENIPLTSSISFADMTFMGGREYYTAPGPGGEMTNYTMEKDYGLIVGGLELDADYDAAGLGAMHGRITIYIHEEEVTVERAAEVLLELKYYFVEAGLPFRGIHLTLCEPLNENGQNVGEQISLKDFLYEDIYEEGLVERVQAAWDEVQAHYAQMDGAVKEEPVPKTTEPTESTVSSSSEPFAEYYALLEYTYPETNWLRNAMGCVFEEPAQIDLEFLFYSGYRDGSWERLSPESEAALIDQGFWREMDLQPMPVSQIEEVLNKTFGISLSACTIPDGWAYAEKEDFYCSNHNDAYILEHFTITDVEDDGQIVRIHYHVNGYFYNTATEEFLDDVDMTLTLERVEDGRLLAVSNLVAP